MRQAAVTASILGLGLILYHQALYCDFVFDDISAIKTNKDLKPDTPWSQLLCNDFWGTPLIEERSHKSYRPVTVLTFRLNYAYGELEPFGYHLVNILLHVIVTIQLYRLCRQTLLYNEMTSISTSLLFLVHPIHTEAVTGVVGRAELLSAFFSLAALSLYSTLTKSLTRISLAGIAGFVVLITLATLSKEQGITISAVCILYDVFIVQQMTVTDVVILMVRLVRYDWAALTAPCRDVIIRCSVIIVSVLAIVAVRMYIMGGQLPTFTVFDNPAASQLAPYRHLTYNYLTAVNIWLLVCPSMLCCDWTMGTVPVITSLLDYRIMSTVVVYTVSYNIIKYALSRRNPFADQVLLGTSLLVIPFIPASNLLFPVGFVVAERVLYMPSVGYCLLFGALFNRLYQQNSAHKLWKNALCGSYMLLILSGMIRTHTRNHDWLSQYSLFTSALRFTERNAKVWNNIGHCLEADDNLIGAIHYFSNAARVQPDDIGSHINIGRTLKALGRNSEAEAALDTALNLMPQIKKGQSYTARIPPSHLNAFITLGSLISMNSSRLAEADQLYKQAISMRSDFIEAYINDGDVLLRMGKKEEALKQYKTALLYENNNADIYYNLGVVYLDVKQTQQAMIHFNKALAINPHHWQSLYNTVLMIQESGQRDLYPEAERRLQLLLQQDSNNSKVYFTAALLATDNHKYSLAEEYFLKCVSIEPEFEKALFNLALLLSNELSRPLDALPYLEQTLKLNPEHIKSYLLVGDIAINHLHNLDMAERGRHNLCVVYAERGDLIRAQQCLTDVLKLSPTESYIQDHLDIITRKLNQQRQTNHLQP